MVEKDPVEPAASILGINLGLEDSVVAVIENGNPTVIQNRYA